MKSIVEEASSIIKAIEKAWVRAGSPHEFSVKVFEDSQKSFFGLTTKQAKVGVFFEIEQLANGHQRPHGQPKEEHRHKKPAPAHHREPVLKIMHKQPSVASMPKIAPELVNETAHEDEVSGEGAKKRVAWHDDMLTAVSKWLGDLLKIANMGHFQPTMTVVNNRLIVMFEKPIVAEAEKAAQLYRSLSYLLIGMVRSKFKKEFRFLKIVLTDTVRNNDYES